MIDWNIKMRSEELVRLSDDFKSVMDTYCTFWSLESILQDKIIEGEMTNNIYEYNLQFKDEAMQKEFLQALNYLQIQIVSLSKKNNK